MHPRVYLATDHELTAEARLRGAMAAATLPRAASDRAASEAERMATGLLREAGLKRWGPGYVVGGYEVDLAFPENRVAIEIGGWAWHSDW